MHTQTDSREWEDRGVHHSPVSREQDDEFADVDCYLVGGP